MNHFYCAGRKARIADKGYDSNPHSRKTLNAHYLWCAGWNDEDMRLKNMRYFVNDTTGMVRTDDTGTYKPSINWREVSLADWEAFRKENKGKRK